MEHISLIGALTRQIDGVQILVAAFFLFFAGLVYYLRREDKREGYPLEDVSPLGVLIEGFPPMPPPKPFLLMDGSTTFMPHPEVPAPINARPLLRFPGAPLVPVGDPMLAAVGPGAYPLRLDEVLMAHGRPQLQPLRRAEEWRVAKGEADPRGMTVFDPRHAAVGQVVDLWVDRSVKILRYLEVELAIAPHAGRRVLLPIYYAGIHARRRWIRVDALLAHQFAAIPGHADPDMITAREEDRLNAYYAGAGLYGRGREAGLTLPADAAAGAQP